MYAYEDNTILFVRNFSNDLEFRLVHKIEDKTFKSFNITLGVGYNQILPLITNYILILQTILQKNVCVMKVINWDGKITSEVTIGTPPLTNVSFCTVHPNLRNDAGFLMVMSSN